MSSRERLPKVESEDLPPAYETVIGIGTNFENGNLADLETGLGLPPSFEESVNPSLGEEAERKTGLNTRFPTVATIT